MRPWFLLTQPDVARPSTRSLFYFLVPIIQDQQSKKNKYCETPERSPLSTDLRVSLTRQFIIHLAESLEPEWHIFSSRRIAYIPSTRSGSVRVPVGFFLKTDKASQIDNTSG